MLLTYKGQNLAVLEVQSKWTPNKTVETKACYGTTSLEHPGTLMVATERGKYYIGGKLLGLELPKRWVHAGSSSSSSSGGGSGGGAWWWRRQCLCLCFLFL